MSHESGPQQNFPRAWSVETTDGLPVIPDNEAVADSPQTPEADQEQPDTQEEQRSPEEQAAYEALMSALRDANIEKSIDDEVAARISELEAAHKYHSEQASKLEDQRQAAKVGRFTGKKKITTRKARQFAAEKQVHNYESIQLQKEVSKLRTSGAESMMLQQGYNKNNQTPAYQKLVAGVRNLQETVDAMSKIHELPEDDTRRQFLEQELGDETIEQYWERKLKEEEQKYIENQEGDQIDQFEGTEDSLIARAHAEEKAVTEKDPAKRAAMLEEIANQEKSLDQMREEMLGDNLDAYQEWVAKDAAEELARKINEIKAKIEEEKKNREKEDEKIRTLNERITELNNKPTRTDTEEGELAQKGVELNDLNKRVAARENLHEIEQKAIANAEAHFEFRRKIAGLE